MATHGLVAWAKPVPFSTSPAIGMSGMATAAFAKSDQGLLRIEGGRAITFWPNATTGASTPARIALPVTLEATLAIPAASGFVLVEGKSGAAGNRVFFLPVTAEASGLGTPVMLANLPVKMSGISATVIGSRIFVVDRSGAVIASDLLEAGADRSSTPWRSITTLPVSGRGNHPCATISLVGQYDGQSDRLHAFCTIHRGNSLQLQVWKLDDRSPIPVWKQGAGSPLLTNRTLAAIVAQSQTNILAFASSSATGPASAEQAEILVYNTVIDRWRASPAVFPWHEHPVVIGSGSSVYALHSDASGVALSQFSFGSSSKRFGFIDMSVIAAYLIGMVFVGWWFKGRTNSTDEFFRGGQSIPWWAAALSIHAALLSSLTYLGLPALVYRSNWVMFIGMLIVIPITPIVVHWIMPFFRRIDATSAYEYLSRRFDMPIRILASSLFAVFHVGRMAIVLSLAGLALASVTPLAPWQSVLLMGVLSMAYSSMGGVEAVVWTEALQTFVLSAGALLCFVFLIHGIEGGLPSYFAQGLADGKFTMIDWNFGHGSWLTFSIWVVILGGVGQNLSTYGADQAVIQRYLVTSSEKKAASAIWLNALTTAPTGAIFFLIGSALFYFYRAHPERLDPSIQIDQIFPAFIANEMPTGAAGLVIAGVFAATQSAVATSMHSISTTVVVDFLRPSRLHLSDQAQLRAARWLTVAAGGLGTVIGLVFINPAIRSLFEAYMAVVGMSMGALGGLFLAGVTTRRASGLSALLGLLGGVAIMIWLWRTNLINPYLFSAVGLFSCYALAWLFSFVVGSSKNDLSNLTILTLTDRPVSPHDQEVINVSA